jgi:hypothetical protein
VPPETVEEIVMLDPIHAVGELTDKDAESGEGLPIEKVPE